MGTTISRRIFLRLFGLALLGLGSFSITACQGSHNPAEPSGSSFNLYSSVVVADLNGDGKPDIATCYFRVGGQSSQPGTVAVFLQDPMSPGHFQSPLTYSVGNNPFVIVAADLNGDGKLDLVTANTTLGAAGTNIVSVLLQDGNHPGQFLPATNYDSANVVNSVAVGDINGDGLLDLAVADSSGVSFLLQSSANPGTFVSANGVNIPGGATFLALSDINADGASDLVVAAATNLLVFLGDSAAPGSFGEPRNYVAGQQPTFVAVADLNGDGKPDLAVSDIGPNGGTTTGLHVLLQDPGAPGQFLNATDYQTGGGSPMVAVADLNGDGKPDLAAVVFGAQGANNILLLPQSGTAGHFQSGATYPGINGITWVAVSDVNGDGNPDLVIADDGIFVRLQDPADPGKFQSPIMITAPQ